MNRMFVATAVTCFFLNSVAIAQDEIPPAESMSEDALDFLSDIWSAEIGYIFRQVQVERAKLDLTLAETDYNAARRLFFQGNVTYSQMRASELRMTRTRIRVQRLETEANSLLQNAQNALLRYNTAIDSPPEERSLETVLGLLLNSADNMISQIAIANVSRDLAARDLEQAIEYYEFEATLHSRNLTTDRNLIIAGNDVTNFENALAAQDSFIEKMNENRNTLIEWIAEIENSDVDFR